MRSIHPSYLVRARAFTGFEQLVHTYGGDSSALLISVGINPITLKKPEASILLTQVIDVVNLAATSLQLDDFGLRLSDYQDLSVLGPLALMAKHCETVRDLILRISQNLSYHIFGARVSLETDDEPGYSRFCYQFELPGSAGLRHVVELSYANSMKSISVLVPDFKNNLRVHFRHRKGLSAQRYYEYFGCEVKLSQTTDALIFPTSILDRPIYKASAVLEKIALRHIEDIILSNPLNVAGQVRILISQQLGSGGCTLPQVAQQLGLHERTLQRRLAKQGVHFENIVDDLRQELSRKYLAREETPLAVLVNLLGYSEQSVFNRACQRWFGMPPMQFRRALQEAAGH